MFYQLFSFIMHNFCDPLKKLLLEQDFLQVATIDI